MKEIEYVVMMKIDCWDRDGSVSKALEKQIHEIFDAGNEIKKFPFDFSSATEQYTKSEMLSFGVLGEKFEPSFEVEELTSTSRNFKTDWVFRRSLNMEITGRYAAAVLSGRQFVGFAPK